MLPFRFSIFVLLVLVTHTISYGSIDNGKAENYGPLCVKSLEREKIYIHVDRYRYHLGDTIWFKAYLTGNALKQDEISQIGYVDLIDPNNQIVSSKTISLKTDSGHGSFGIANNYSHGEYTIRAYTNFMKNFDSSLFFTKRILIDSISSSKTVSYSEMHQTQNIPDLQFFPEGGTIVAGFVNRIAFKAIGHDGYGIDISGSIIDESNNMIVNFESSHLGMGMLSFIPEQDKKYIAQIQHNNVTYTYNLPTILGKGTMLNVTERGGEYQVEIRSSDIKGLNQFMLEVHQSNQKTLNIPLSDKRNKAVVNIPVQSLKPGIVRFTLLNNKKRPICERLIFSGHNIQQSEAFVKLANRAYGKRELVELDIEFSKNLFQRPLSMSISITDSNLASPKNKFVDIKTYMLLTSELKGEIENAGYYFNSKDPARKRNLDFLMMTQGWRGFIKRDEQDNTLSKLPFITEKGITISGRVTRTFSRDKPVSAEVNLTYQSNNEIGYDRAQTDKNGQFKFTNLNFADTTAVFISANSTSKTANPSFFIKIDSVIPPKVHPKQSFSKGFPQGTTSILLSSYDGKPLIEDKSRLIQLEETVVEAEKWKKKTTYERKRENALYNTPSQTIDFKEIRKTPYGNVLMRLQGRIPGFTYYGSSITLYNAANMNRPLILLDGVPIDFDTLLSFPVAEIDFVDVIKGGLTTLYGSLGGHGVLAIYTLDGREQYDAPNSTRKNGVGTLKYTHPGYGYSKKFYHPRYPLNKQLSENPDYRKTLYWNPNIKASKDRNVKLSFYSADISTSYKVVLQGLTKDGEPFYSTETFSVEQREFD